MMICAKCGKELNYIDPDNDKKIRVIPCENCMKSEYNKGYEEGLEEGLYSI